MSLEITLYLYHVCYCNILWNKVVWIMSLQSWIASWRIRTYRQTIRIGYKYVTFYSIYYYQPYFLSSLSKKSLKKFCQKNRDSYFKNATLQQKLACQLLSILQMIPEVTIAWMMKLVLRFCTYGKIGEIRFQIKLIWFQIFTKLFYAKWW